MEKNHTIKQFDVAINDLKEAWRELASNLELKTQVRVSIRHKMVACSHDILAMASVLKDEYLKELDKSVHDAKSMRNTNILEFSNHWAEVSLDRILGLHRLSSIFKAMFYFIRALQDSCYGILLELRHDRAGQHTSMYDCYNKTGNPIHQDINIYLPDYFGWFVSHRQLRNRMKLGIEAGLEYKSEPGPHELFINYHEIDEHRVPPTSEIMCKIGLSDLTVALDHSVSLLRYANSKIS